MTLTEEEIEYLAGLVNEQIKWLKDRMETVSDTKIGAMVFQSFLQQKEYAEKLVNKFKGE